MAHLGPLVGNSVVQYVGFRLAGDEDALRDSHAAITSCELHSPAGEPVRGGVYDLRLGTTDHNYLCRTCALGKKLCPGHRGHLVLRVAVTQPVAIAEIRRWLRVVCLRCSAVIVDREKYAALPPGRRLAEAATAAAEGRLCPRCGAAHPRITKDEEDNFTFWVAPPGERRHGPEGRGAKLYPDMIRAIFDRVSDSAVAALGRPPESHPRRLVRRVVAVPPNTIRPGVRSYAGSGSSYHDSTNLLQNLVKRNSLLPEKLPDAITALDAGAVSRELDYTISNLQQLYYNLIYGSSSTSVTQGASGRRGLVVGARPVHSFMRNLPRKEGRLRANLLGGRVFYISRTTISGNMFYRVDEVGVPLAFARCLQVEETVQEYNRAWLTPFFLNGRRQYPGCTIVVRRATREAHDVAGLRDQRLEIGDVLYRDVVSGDLAYFNRQPTLERSSIGVHRVVVIQDPSVHTFQINVLACENYNADFDGDQMNLWIARGPAARAEADTMSSIANWFISTKSGGPVNGEVQDSVVGSYELTRSATRLDRYHAMGLFATTGLEPPRFDGEARRATYTGRELVSLVLQTAPVSYSRAPSSYSGVYAPYLPYDKSETLTVVERGVLVSGVLDKKSVGAKATGGLFHLISREYGAQRALDLVYALQQVALQFLLWRGFTVGTADLIPNAEAQAGLRALAARAVLDSRVVTDRLLRGDIVPPIGSTVRAFYESLQLNALRIDEAGALRWILGSMRPRTNGFFRMIAVGSKGSNPNMINVSGQIGQTKINEERIREQFAFRRTSPYYPRFATDPAAYGFVTNSYISGMRAGEFIAQGMNGRFDLISKTLTTSVTGYFARKGVMNNQSSIVDNLRRVTKDTHVVQFLYGEDGLDARALERVRYPFAALGDAALAAAALPPGGAPGAWAEELSALRADRDAFREAFLRTEDSNFAQPFPEDVLAPVNVRRLLEAAAAAPGADLPAAELAAGLAGRVARVADLCRSLPYVLSSPAQERARAPLPPRLAAAAFLVCALVRAELTPRALAGLSDARLAFVADSLRLRYSLALIEYGSAAGIIAAQAISEPMTQYMLDSHHRSVAGGTNKAGLVRVSEIYGARPVSEEQSSAMLLRLLPRAGDAAAHATAVAAALEFITLEHLTACYDMLVEPYGALEYPPCAADSVWLAEFERAHPLVSPPGDLSNWCFRFVLDKASLVLKGVDLELIVRRLRSRHPGLYVVHTPESAPEVVVRGWHRAALFHRGDAEERARGLLAEVLDTPVRGVRGITRAVAERVTRRRVAEDNALGREEVYAVATVGTNLYSALLHSAVDSRRAVSSSIGDTAKMYGIEAAAAKIVSATRDFMADGAPNARHLVLFADEMTRTGRVTSIERGGLGTREHNNVFLRMAYGSPVQVVTEAALAGASARVYGIAAPQALGAIPRVGTLYNTVHVDEEFVRANVQSVDQVLDLL